MAEPMPTKELIMRQSVRLFATNGYDAVSVKNIADACKIRPASIYSHYSSKEDILHTILAYYKENCFRMRLTKPQYLPILRRGTREEILGIFTYVYHDFGQPDHIMFDITRILFSRRYIDPEVGQVAKDYLYLAALEFINEVLQAGREVGRILNPPETFDTVARVILACRVYIATAVVTDPEEAKWERINQDMVKMIACLLELAPPLE